MHMLISYHTGMNTLVALADPRRRAILDVLRGGEHAVSDLVGALGLSQPEVSKHLRALRQTGLVEVRVAGPWRFYRIAPEPLRELDAWLAPYRELWERGLDRLERHLDELPD
jgi:DNA-binding transcriptional ArsR family regulator